MEATHGLTQTRFLLLRGYSSGLKEPPRPTLLTPEEELAVAIKLLLAVLFGTTAVPLLLIALLSPVKVLPVAMSNPLPLVAVPPLFRSRVSSPAVDKVLGILAQGDPCPEASRLEQELVSRARFSPPPTLVEE